MSNKHLDQAHHNFGFFKNLQATFPKRYNDWKVTVLFYTALHAIEAIAEHKKIDLGDSHKDREKAIKPGSSIMPVSQSVFNHYRYIKKASVDCRYVAPFNRKTMDEFLEKDIHSSKLSIKCIAEYVEKQCGLDCEILKAA